MAMWMPGEALAWAVAAAADGERAARYVRYRRYYDGDQDLSFMSQKWRQAFGSRLAMLAYNRCSAVVDAHADRLFVDGFAHADPAVAEAAAGIWSRNRMDRRQDEVYTEAFAMGDGYVLVWPDAETGRPTIWPQPAGAVRVLGSEEQPGRIDLAAKCWTARGGVVRLNVYHPDRIERWVTEQPRRVGGSLKPESFVPFAGDAAGPVIANPYGAVPVFPFANNARTGEYGASELRDILPLQDALNKALADLLVAQESAAFPQKVIIGVNAAADPFANPDPQAGEAAREGIGRFALGMDRILALADPAAKIAEFSSVALTQFTEVAEGWDTRISRQSRVPVHYLSLSGNFPSGRALRTAETPFVAKIEDRQRAFGAVWQDAMTFALRVAGIETGEAPVEVVWRSAAPMASEDAWDLVRQQVAAGIPLELAVELELGWDTEKIARLRELRAGPREPAAAVPEDGGVDGTAGGERDREGAEESGPVG